MRRTVCISLIALISAVGLAQQADAPPASRSARRRKPPAQPGGDMFKRLAKHADIKRNIVFKAVGEQQLMLDFYVPKAAGGEKLPTVVFIHGGGWRAGTKNAVYAERFVGTMERLLAAGVQVVSIDYRLASEKARYKELIADCKDSVRWLHKDAAKWRVDPERMGVWGPSAGGHLALMVGLTGDGDFPGDKALQDSSSKVKFIVSWYGTTDFLEHYRESGRRIGGVFTTLLGGTPEDAPQAYKEASPISYVTKTSVPMLLCQGAKDFVVPRSQAEILAAKAREVGAPVEYLLVANAGHNFQALGGTTLRPSLAEVQKRTADFMFKYLGAKAPATNPAPGQE